MSAALIERLTEVGDEEIIATLRRATRGELDEARDEAWREWCPPFRDLVSDERGRRIAAEAGNWRAVSLVRAKQSALHKWLTTSKRSLALWNAAARAFDRAAERLTKLLDSAAAIVARVRREAAFPVWAFIGLWWLPADPRSPPALRPTCRALESSLWLHAPPHRASHRGVRHAALTR